MAARPNTPPRPIIVKKVIEGAMAAIMAVRGRSPMPTS